jgi:hypothetical protein
MTFLVCGLVLFSEKSLEEVAEILSAKLIAGIPFVGRDEFIYDEIPAVYAERDVLGLRIILQGFGGEDGYQLEIRPRDYPSENKPLDLTRTSRVDITDFIGFLLKDIKELRLG